MSDLLEAAQRYHAAGLCVIASDVLTKRPVGRWKQYLKERPHEKQLTSWFGTPKDGRALSIVCGKVSGGVELIDFDCQGEAWKPWARKIKDTNPALFGRLVVERSQSGGYHVVYRCEEIQIPGSAKLAHKRVVVDGDGDHGYLGKSFRARRDAGEWVISPDLIETRGEGGQFLCAPTAGYELLQGDMAKPPVVSKSERKLMLDAAKALDEGRREKGPVDPPAKPGRKPAAGPESSGLKPWEDFDRRGDVWGVLARHGWQKAGKGGAGNEGDKTEWIVRPGKDPREGHSGSIINGKLVKIWTSNASPFEPDKTYTPSQVFAILECGDDWKATARKMRALGYGDPPDRGPKPKGRNKGAPGGNGGGKGLPTIVTNGRQLVDIRADVWAAVQACNDPPRLFDSAGGVARVGVNADTGEQTIALLGPRGMIHELASMAVWVEERRNKDDVFHINALPHPVVCGDLLEQVCPPLPFLKRVAESPIFTAGGHLHMREGYDPDSRTILRLGGLKVPPVPKCPAAGDVAASVDLIEELVCDIPFISESEKAHAVAAMILPFVRDMIQGPTPMHSIEASTPGTGKSLLMKLLMTPALARPPASMTEARDEDEWRKRITAKLLSGPTVLLIDNVKRKLDSGALSQALTEPVWEDRILGATKMVKAPITVCWMMTGNNIQMSSELVRRTVRIRLDAMRDRPWERPREQFRHPNVIQWAMENRPALVRAVLTIVQAWIGAGRPRANISPLGTYERWSEVMGGILAHAGIPGFLANMNEFYEQSDEEGEVLRSLVSVWWDEFGGVEVLANDLREMIDRTGAVPIDLGKVSERAQSIRLGKKLKAMAGRHFTLERENERVEYRVVKCGSKQGAAKFRLKKIGEEMEVAI